MKKRILALLAACLLLLAACHRTTEQPPRPQPEPPVTEPVEPEDNGITVESAVTSGTETGQGDVELLRWSLSLPQVKWKGQPMMNIGNYYDTLQEKSSLRVQEELLPMAQERREVADVDGSLFTPFSWEAEYAVARNKGNYLSIKRQTTSFTGGVHEANELAAENWLLRDGDCYLLSIQDILPGAGSPRDLLLDKAVEQAAAKAAEQPDAFFEQYEQLMRDVWQERDWFLTEQAVCLFFPEYAIGPYIAGPQVFEIPLGDLGDSLAEGLR